jgi:two-component system response regulator AtoC
LVLLGASSQTNDAPETIGGLRRLKPDLPVIVLAEDPTPSEVVSAMRSGASDVIPRTVGNDDLAGAMFRALNECCGAGARNGANAKTAAKSKRLHVVGSWNEKLDLFIDRVSASDVPVLLRGETGVGKEMLARRLHQRSPRADRPFLKLNCAALPSELIESELFGFEKGAFTGAYRSMPGKFELADGGTILLDEIGDMDVRLQAKLLQVVQDHEFHRLGSGETSKVNVRVMAATHCDLERAIADGSFREDLYYRLNIIDIHIPPLRERMDEVIPLAEYFFEAYATPANPALPLPHRLRQALLDHTWPGNVRELENVIRKYLVLGSEDEVIEGLNRRNNRTAAAMEVVSAEPETLPQIGPSSGAGVRGVNSRSEANGRGGGSFTAAGNLEEIDNSHRAAEMSLILRALDSARWNRKRAAEILRIDYKALLYRMKKLGIGESDS